MQSPYTYARVLATDGENIIIIEITQREIE